MTTANTNVNTKAEAEAQRTFELYPTLPTPANYPPPPPPVVGPTPPPTVPQGPPPGYDSYQAGPSTPPENECKAERTPLVGVAQDGAAAPNNRTVTTTFTTTTTTTNPGVFTEETTCGQECVSALWLWGGLSWLFAVCYWLFALVYLLSIVGIPIGLDAMRAARMVQVCHGRQLKWKYEQVGSCSQTTKCIFWFPCGICVALLHFALGVMLCCTLVGIPFGITHFKLVPVAICPFGLELHQHKH